ncbi:MAG: carboxymethylenebutenolidase [Candidatus Azotimanducaceae bacterium]|jgi:carboxymethylenebutenolidase
MVELSTTTHQLQLQHGAMDVHVVMPSVVKSPVPLVIVIHDILGFNDDTRRIAWRLTSGPMGLAVVAPDLYQGLGPKPICVVKTLASLKRKEGITFDRLRAVQAWSSSIPEIDGQRVAVVGFCMGGGFALLYSNEAEVSVVAPFYGDVPLVASELKNICPVVGGYGERDAIFGPEGHRLVSHLQSLSVPHDVKFYPDAGHSYMNQLKGMAKLARWTPMRGAFDETAAEDSWQRVFRFFEKHL